MAQGLVERRPSPTDRRAQIVSLTTEGRRTFRAMARANGDWVAELFADLAPAESDELMRLLAKTMALTVAIFLVLGWLGEMVVDDALEAFGLARDHGASVLISALLIVPASTARR